MIDVLQRENEILKSDFTEMTKILKAGERKIE